MIKYDPRLTHTTKYQIIEKIMSSFSSMYLTMISIVQGVALALLIDNISGIIKWDGMNFNPYKVEIALTTFFVIILSWHSYFWLASIARWVPTIWDSILFFVFGASEFFLIESLSILHSFAWFYFFAITGIIGSIQYSYNSKRLKDNDIQIDKIRIWSWNVTKLGEHISEYKKKRSENLMITSCIFFGYLIGIDLMVKNSYITTSCSIYIKFILVTFILFYQFYLIIRHIKDQKITIDILLKI